MKTISNLAVLLGVSLLVATMGDSSIMGIVAAAVLTVYAATMSIKFEAKGAQKQ